MASPVVDSKPVAVTAQSATGTCHGPTIWSRTVRPPTVRSPIVIKNCLLATAGSCSTRLAASARSEEHTSELQSLMRISYAVFCLKKNSEDHQTERRKKY